MTYLIDALQNDEEYIVFFTGAGMSTESGLPDFRSANDGLWGKIDPAQVASVDAMNRQVEQFFEFYKMRIDAVNDVQPNKGHYILSDWQKRGYIHDIITQNVDGFHTTAGCKRVHELHGTLLTVRCSHCEKQFPNTTFAEADFHCDECEHPLRPNVVLFGEMLPEKPFNESLIAAQSATTFVVLGSSLTVSPANQFPLIAKESGAHLIIVNRDETPFDSFADEVIQDQTINEYLLHVHETIEKRER